MKQTLTNEQRASIVKYRLERAHETLKEADYNTNGGYYNAAINRMYYACFYAASALLLSRQIEANTHNGVKTLFSLEFVRNGQIDPKHASTLNLLFDRRQSSDYNDFVYCDLEEVNLLRPHAESFVKTIEEFIYNACK